MGNVWYYNNMDPLVYFCLSSKVKHVLCKLMCVHVRKREGEREGGERDREREREREREAITLLEVGSTFFSQPEGS